jgi:hypothetical protein
MFPLRKFQPFKIIFSSARVGLKGQSHDIILRKVYRTVGLNKGTRLVFKSLGGSNDFIMQELYLLWSMLVCVGLIL